MSGTRLHSRSVAEGRRSPVSDPDCASSPTLSLPPPRAFPPLLLGLKISNTIAFHMWSLN